MQIGNTIPLSRIVSAGIAGLKAAGVAMLMYGALAGNVHAAKLDNAGPEASAVSEYSNSYTVSFNDNNLSDVARRWTDGKSDTLDWSKGNVGIMNAAIVNNKADLYRAKDNIDAAKRLFNYIVKVAPGQSMEIQAKLADVLKLMPAEKQATLGDTGAQNLVDTWSRLGKSSSGSPADAAPAKVYDQQLSVMLDDMSLSDVARRWTQGRSDKLDWTKADAIILDNVKVNLGAKIPDAKDARDATKRLFEYVAKHQAPETAKAIQAQLKQVLTMLEPTKTNSLSVALGGQSVVMGSLAKKEGASQYAASKVKGPQAADEDHTPAARPR